MHLPHQKVLFSVLTVGVLFAGPVRAQASEPEVIKVATVAPENTPWSALMDRVKKRLQKESNGAFKMKVYLGGRLGGEKETVRETREGRVQMWGGSTAAIATVVPELYGLESPFLFESSDEADFVLDQYVRPHVTELLADRGFVLYQFAENGWHGLALKTGCAKTPADLKGLKIRSQEATIHLDTFKALGANPVEIAVPEVLPALQQGTVDGFSNTPLFTFAVSWHQGVKYFTVTDHVYQPAVIVYSKKWFDKQSKEHQALLLSNVEADTKFGRDGVRSIRDGLLDNFRASKIEVCELTKEQREAYRKATEAIFGKYMAKASKKGKAMFQAVLEGKKAWAAKKG